MVRFPESNPGVDDVEVVEEIVVDRHGPFMSGGVFDLDDARVGLAQQALEPELDSTPTSRPAMSSGGSRPSGTATREAVVR